MSILNVHDPLQVPNFPSNPVLNGRLFVFERNSEVFVALFEDPDLTTSIANPLEADENGNFPPCFLVDGTYKLVLRSQSGKLLNVWQEIIVTHVTQNVAGQREFTTIEDLELNTSLLYDTHLETARVLPGEIISVTDGSYHYEVASETVTDQHITTQGGVKLYERGAFSTRARFVETASRGWMPPVGHTETIEGRDYVFMGDGFTDGPADLPGWRPEGLITPEHFSSDLTADATPAFNEAMLYAVSNNLPGRSSGVYTFFGTLAPGGQYNWDWGNTQINWGGGDVTALTQVLYNPLGSTEPQPSGKYVIFDTNGCEGSINTGLLRIRGVSIGKMTMYQRSLIPSNLVAITASEGSSADMIWDGLSILGCGHGLWQGDQRGSAQNILPYTRWSVRFLLIKFCLVAINGGSSGNSFDDGNWNNIRLTRNQNNGTIRTDFVCNSIFLNGLNFKNDIETPTITTSAGSTLAMLSVGTPYVKTGDVICIEDGNLDLSGTTPIPFVTRIAERNGTILTLESAPDRTISGLNFIVNPPSFLMTNASLIAQHVYAEECHDTPINLLNESVIECQSLKFSNGIIAARYNAPLAITGIRDTAVIANLHDRSVNNDKLKSIVGVSNLDDGSGNGGSSLIELTARTKRDVWVNSVPVRVINLESDHLGGLTNTEGASGDGYNVVVQGSDGRTQYMIGHLGTKEAYNVGRAGGFEVGPNLRAEETMTGIERTGGCQASSGGAAVKSAGSAGSWYADVAVSAGDRVRVDLTLDAFTAGSCTVTLYDSAGGNPGTAVASFEHVNGTGRKTVFFDVPAGSTADRVGLNCAAAADLTISRFVVQKVLSV